MRVVKSAGSSATCSLPRGRSAGAAAAAAGATAAATASAAAASRSPIAVLAIGRGADHVELTVELDVDLAAVGLGDLDLVVALLVAGLGLGDPAAAGGRQRRLARALERAAGDRLVATAVAAVVVAAGRAGDRRTARGEHRDHARGEQHALELVPHARPPCMVCAAPYVRGLGSP